MVSKIEQKLIKIKLAALRHTTNGKEFESGTIKNYIESAIKEIPDLKQYAHVLNNPATVKQIMDVIIQELRPYEQQKVLDIFKNLSLKYATSAYKDFETIVRNHCQSDKIDTRGNDELSNSKLMANIESVLRRADYAAYVKELQAKNAEKIHG